MSLPLPEIDVPALRQTERLVGLRPVFLADARTGALPRLKTAVRVGLRRRALCIRFDGRDIGGAKPGPGAVIASGGGADSGHGSESDAE